MDHFDAVIEASRAKRQKIESTSLYEFFVVDEALKSDEGIAFSNIWNTYEKNIRMLEAFNTRDDFLQHLGDFQWFKGVLDETEMNKLRVERASNQFANKFKDDLKPTNPMMQWHCQFQARKKKI